MDTLYDQLLKLQCIPNAYAEWKEYRHALTDFIIRHTGSAASAIIVGAGECNDFDLHRLSEHFSNIILLDRNASAMRNGLKRQGLAPGSVQTVQADLLGITDAAYRRMDDALLCEIRNGKREPQALEERFLLLMHSVLKGRSPSAFVQREAVADYVVCCGVHSQLLNIFPQMAGVYQRSIGLDTDRIYAAVKALNTIVARECNTRLFRMAKQGVVVGLEEGRVGMTGGIEGAAQAFTDLDGRQAPIAAGIRLKWPFDQLQGKIYGMRVSLYRKESGDVHENSCK